jgi:hypothetical protein
MATEVGLDFSLVAPPDLHTCILRSSLLLLHDPPSPQWIFAITTVPLMYCDGYLRFSASIWMWQNIKAQGPPGFL